MLHVICFGYEGYSKKRRKDLLDFDGFGFDDGSDSYNNKLDEIKKIDLPDLFAICHVFDLNYAGKPEEVANRILRFLNECNVDSESALDDEDVEQDEEQDDDNCGDVQEREDDYQQRRNQEKIQEGDNQTRQRYENQRRSEDRISNPNVSMSMNFRDVEESVRKFNGTDDYPIQKWIRDVEDLADLLNWSDLHIFIFAKRLLTGLARLFIQGERNIRKYRNFLHKTLYRKVYPHSQLQFI
ncbi:protein DEK-like [Onthophagus taurus]|uniref:protein DEK-like n=1 Tax=Onthophagus taurus TaxID=166361 RepID=UPI0039BE4E26